MICILLTACITMLVFNKARNANMYDVSTSDGSRHYVAPKIRIAPDECTDELRRQKAEIQSLSVYQPRCNKARHTHNEAASRMNLHFEHDLRRLKQWQPQHTDNIKLICKEERTSMHRVNASH